eukprot:884899-Amphidinium_carterae.1
MKGPSPQEQDALLDTTIQGNPSDLLPLSERLQSIPIECMKCTDVLNLTILSILSELLPWQLLLAATTSTYVQATLHSRLLHIMGKHGILKTLGTTKCANRRSTVISKSK